MQLKHGILPPSLHSAELNPDIDLTGTPFHVQQEAAPWHRPVLRDQDGRETHGPRRAGVSSFGGGGANAHLIVEEYLAQPAEPGTSAPERSPEELIVLSALSEERLRAYARELADFLDRRPGTGQPLGECVRVAADVLRVQPRDLDADLELAEYGLGAAELAALSERLGLPTTVSDRTTLRELARAGSDPAPSLADVATRCVSAGSSSTYASPFPRVNWPMSRPCCGMSRTAWRAASHCHDAARAPRTGGDAADRLARALSDGDLTEAARLWTQGAEAWWPDTGARRIGLPTYPFARKRYWIPEPPRAAEPLRGASRVRAPRRRARSPRRDAPTPHPAIPRPPPRRRARTSRSWASTSRSGARRNVPGPRTAPPPPKPPPPRAPRWPSSPPVNPARSPRRYSATTPLPHPAARPRGPGHPARPARAAPVPPRRTAPPRQPRNRAARRGARPVPQPWRRPPHHRRHRRRPRRQPPRGGHPRIRPGPCRRMPPPRPHQRRHRGHRHGGRPARAPGRTPAPGGPRRPAAGRPPPRPQLVRTPVPAPRRPPYRTGGTYLMVGGSGGIGRALSEELAHRHRARIVWISRGELGANSAPPPTECARPGDSCCTCGRTRPTPRR